MNKKVSVIVSIYNCYRLNMKGMKRNMKRIGVVTWFRYLNYGTILQATALQKYLTKNGYESKLINFQLDDSKNIKKKHKRTMYTIFVGILFRLSKIIYKKDIYKKEKEMNSFIDSNCTVTEKINTDNDYIRICNCFDYIIFGSDQIWNPNWYHKYYFGAFDEIKSRFIAYAPSIGVHEIPNEYVNLYKNNLKKFDAVGMREHYASEIISKMTNTKIYDVIDPVFLLNNHEWEKFKSEKKVPKEEYILCYLLTDNNNHWKAIKNYAKKKKKRLVIISTTGYSYLKFKYNIVDCNISDFIGLFSNASEVITDSFHGTAFSIIFNKQFMVFERHNPLDSNSQNDRIYNLLEVCGIKKEKFLLNYNTSKCNITEQINYTEVNKSLSTTINESKTFLINTLK